MPKVKPIDSIGFLVVDKTAPDQNGTTDKAVCRKDGVIEVAHAWWKSLSHAQKAAVLAHEDGHASGLDCEMCCDRHGGYMMRGWGFTTPAIKMAYDVRAGVARGALALEGAKAYDSTYQMTGAGIDSLAVRAPTIANKKGTATSTSTLLKVPAPSSLVTHATPIVAPGAPANPPPLPPVSPRLDPGGPAFNPAHAEGDPSQEGLDALFSGLKVDPVIVRSEVLSGLLVAFLVFVIFRWGGNA